MKHGTARLRLGLDALALLLVAALAAYLSLRHVAEHYPRASFYQASFGPAASFACGGGWKNIAVDPNERLGEFLAFRLPRLDCAEVGVRQALPTRSFQDQHLYLLGAVALWWKLRGELDWPALHGLFCALFVVSAIAAYALLRLAAPPPLAAVGAALFAASEAHLRNLIHLRDYSKAPFLLAGVAAIVLIVCRWRARLPLLVAASATAGVSTGLGVGFRQDLLLLVPFGVASIALFCGASPAVDLRKKLVLISVFLAVFAVAAAPVLGALRGGSNTGHVILLGLGSGFDPALSVRTAYYEFGDQYNDAYVRSLVTAAHQSRGGDSGFLRLASEPYEQAAMEYLRALLATAPADFATRAAGAMLSILSYDYGIPFLPKTATLVLVFAALVLLVQVLHREQALRTIAFPAFVFLYFTAAAFLQFQERHFFHLALLHVAILTWGAETLRAQAGAFALAVRSRAAFRPEHWRARGVALARNVLVLALILGAAYGGLLVLRHLQTGAVRAFFDRAADPTAYTSLARADTPKGPRYSLGDDSAPRAEEWLEHEYLMARFDASRCGLAHVHPLLRYEAKDAFHDFTRRYRLAIHGDTKFLLPVFRSNAFRFLGLELPAEEAACVVLVGKKADKRLAFFPVTRLEEDWRQRAPYQTLWIEPRPDLQRYPEDYLEPEGVRVEEQRAWQHLARLEILRREALAYMAPGGSATATGIAVHMRGTSAYLVEKPAAESAPGCRLAIVAEGEIRQGALTVGALTAGKEAWDSSVSIARPGWFRALVLAKGRRAVPIVANDARDFRKTSAMIARLGAVELCP